MALYDYDKPISHISFDLKDVKYENANDARLNPDIFFYFSWKKLKKSIWL